LKNDLEHLYLVQKFQFNQYKPNMSNEEEDSGKLIE